MIFYKEPYRDFEFDRLVFEVTAEAQRAKNPTELWHGKETKEMGFGIDGMNAEQVGQKMRDTYGPERYQAVITAYVSKIYGGKGDPAIQETLVQKVTEGYTNRFDEPGGIYSVFVLNTAKLERAFKEAIGRIKDHTKADLKTLHDKVNLGLEADKKKPTVEPVPPFAKESKGRVPILNGNLPILGPIFGRTDVPILSPILHSPEWRAYKEAEEKTKDDLRKFLEVKFKEHMTPELYKSDLGEKLRAGTLMRAEGEIALLFREGKATKESLEKFEKQLLETINGYAALDGNAGDLSIKDAVALLKQARAVDTNLLAMVNADNYEGMLAGLEARRAMNPRDWIEASVSTAQEMMAEIVRNGNEAAFIKKINSDLEAKNKQIAEKATDPEKAPRYEPVKNFGEAKAIFEKAVALRAAASVKETLDYLQNFNQAVNPERVGILSDVENIAFRTMVLRERDLLLEGKTIAEADHQRPVVEFMQQDTRKERETILKDPARRALLFRSIQALAGEDSAYKEYYEKNVPKEKDVMTQQRNPNKNPTGGDRLARTKALIMLAEEARWIVGNFSQSTDFKTDLTKALAATETEKHNPDTEFRHIDRSFSTRYVSIASRGGFNGKELALSTVKGLAGFTVFINAMNAIKDGGGIGAGGNYGLGALEAMANNPYMFAGLGVVYGINRYRENPKVAHFLTVSPGRREEIMTHARLDTLRSKQGLESLKAFIASTAEWKAMRHIDSAATKDLIEKAKEKRSENGGEMRITKDDLKDTVPAEDWVDLPGKSPAVDRMRFLFYTKMLSGKHEKDQTEALKGQCQSWAMTH